jgi:uncharacterized protein YneF (UPF0154 family)
MSPMCIVLMVALAGLLGLMLGIVIARKTPLDR